MLITEKPETVFDTSEIKAGYLVFAKNRSWNCLLYTSPSPRDCS